MPSITHVGPTFHDESARTASGNGAIPDASVTLSSGDVPGSANSLVVFVVRRTFSVASGGGGVAVPTGLTQTTVSNRTTTGATSRFRQLSFMYGRRGDLTFPITFTCSVTGTAPQSAMYVAVTPVVVSGAAPAAVGPTNDNGSSTTTAAQTLVVSDARGAVMLHGFAAFYVNSGLDTSGGLTPPSATSMSTANSFTLQSDDVTNQEPAGWPFANIGFEVFGLASRIVTAAATYDLPQWANASGERYVVSGAGWGQATGGIFVDGAVH